MERCWKVPAILRSLGYSGLFLIAQVIWVWEVSKRQVSASRRFVDRVLSMLWLPILRDLGKAIEICKAGYNAEIIYNCTEIV